MKSTFNIFLLIMCGVFGTDDELKSLSVMEGYSVTLNINLTQIQGFNMIQWRFGDESSSIARTDGNEISFSTDERFRDRLQLNNQTGSLTIKNMRNKHSGLYKLQIDHSSGTSNTKFFVTVYESLSVIDAAEAETKSVSVKEGGTSTLQTDIINLHGDELIVWRFGCEGKLIAKDDIETKSSTLYDTDERFRDRLELDHQTGSLTIKNTRSTDSGLYVVNISSSKHTLNRRFIVTVSGSGVSPGAVAGIVVVLLLVILIAVCYYRCKISRIKFRILQDVNKFIIVKMGEDVTLNTDADIEAEDQMLWTYEAQGARIAEFKKGIRETFGGTDGIFTDRLMLDDTGSLTIRNIDIGLTGVYILQIKRGFARWPSYKRFNVYINERTISVMEGDDVTLNAGTELSKDNQIKWLFADQCMYQAPIAEINGETGEILTYEDKADGRFRNRLKLDHLTGSLTIKNTSPEHIGFYHIQIRHCRGTTFTMSIVSVSERKISVEEGKSVTLETDSELQKDDQILWMFGAEETLIAQIKGETRETHDVADGRFGNRLKLNESGSLTISNITADHTGAYKAQIISRGQTSYKKFKVVLLAEYVPVMKGDDVTLQTDSKIQKNDQIRWMFGVKNSLIAEIKEETGEIATYNDVLDGRFRGRLELDKETGSLTITDFRTEHTGLYKMKINRSTEWSKNKSFNVFARVSVISEEEALNGNQVNEPETVVKSLLNGDNLDVVNEQHTNNI